MMWLEFIVNGAHQVRNVAVTTPEVRVIWGACKKTTDSFTDIDVPYLLQNHPVFVPPVLREGSVLKI